MSKLTLTVSDRVVSDAKRYAKQQGVSISKLVETYLSEVAQPQPRLATPVLRLIRGSLSKGDRETYRRFLTNKYR
jgi:hypothetical protein